MVLVCSQVALGIVGHPDRADSIDWLADLIQPDVVQIDDEALGCGANHIVTLERTLERALDDGKEWVAVMEDDAIPVDGFRNHLELCLFYAPSKIVSLYLGTGYPQQYQAMFAEAVNADTCWIAHPWMRHAVAYCLHIDVAEAVLEEMRSLIARRWAPDDAIGEFTKRNYLFVSYTNPSLVDHLDGTTVITQRTHRGHATFGRNKVRKAHKFGVPALWNDKYVLI